VSVRYWAFPDRQLCRLKPASQLWGTAGVPTMPKRRNLVESGRTAYRKVDSDCRHGAASPFPKTITFSERRGCPLKGYALVFFIGP
jgi:hypothetical protein